MSTSNCACCGKPCKHIHKHHILPKCLGGLDLSSNIVRICPRCHSKIHNRKFVNHSELTKRGLENARKQGRIGGRRPTFTERALSKAKQLREQGVSCRRVEVITGISASRVSQITKKRKFL